MARFTRYGILTGVFALSLLTLAVWAAQTGSASKRLRRSESYLGIHFDFHAGEDSVEIGRNLTPEMVEEVLEKVHPDYIQVDSKGHPGYSSYPTTVGNQAPGFVKDPLRIFREVTARHGVALYVHHSGVWDAQAVKKHPDWARIGPDGKSDDRLTSVFGPYVDKLLIPQLEELRDEYQVDGVWVDGECWATERDYAPAVLARFHRETGIESVPKEPDQPHWLEFSDFCRNGFRHYLKHYVDTLHRHDPDFQIASNWAYTSMMPEPVTVPVDFISGDFSARNSVNSARLEGRSMVYQGKPWDLMAWSFTWADGLYSTKSPVQLKQEAAMVLSLGGGFQAYFPQKRDGSIRLWQMDLMADVARFCRARQSVCQGAVPVPQLGLIYSGKAFYRTNRKLFAAWGGELVPLRGVLQSLLESQNVVDIVMEHQLEGRMDEYPLLVYPEWDSIEPEFRDKLVEYVRRGGNLLVIGPSATGLFRDELGVDFVGEPEDLVNGLFFQDRMAGIKSRFQEVNLKEGTEGTGTVFNRNPETVNDPVGEGFPAASIRQLGGGKIAGIYLDLGERYVNSRTEVSRDFLADVVRRLVPDPVVSVRGSHFVDVTLNRVNGKLALNLVNTGGPHADEKVNVFDEIPAVGPLTIEIRTPRKPDSLTLVPEGGSLPFRYSDGVVHALLPRLEIHQIILVD